MSGSVVNKVRNRRVSSEPAPPSRRAGGDGRATLVVAPSAARRLAAARAWLAAYPLDAEVVVVAPSLEACDEVVREDVRTCGARFGIMRATLGRIAGQLAAPALAARGHVPASGLSLDAVAARAVHQLVAAGRLRYFTPVAGRPGFPLAVARTHRTSCVRTA